MAFVVALACLAALVWGAIAFRWFTPVGVAIATVGIGYVLGYEFWNIRLGPLPLTIDRLLIGVLLSTLAYQAWQGRLRQWTPTAVDWAVFALLGWLTASCVISNVGSDADLPASPFFRLLFSFWAPALLYLSVRLQPLSNRTTSVVLALLTALGTYLSLTAVAEISGQWWAVFPKYIADPDLGTHFGRARGPALNSVSLGNYLCVCFWAAWTLRPRVSRQLQLALFGCMALMLVGVALTFTRSIWLGLALSGFVMLIAETPRRLRMPVAIGATACSLVLASLAWSFVVNLNREDSGSVSQHSVHQRTAFAYVSWNMWCDEPLTGVGFGRFYDKKLPYLSDRSQSFELESIRELHHHNTFLGLAVETGLAGLAAYLAMLLGWGIIGIRMAFGPGYSLATQQAGRLMLAALCVYLPSLAFHDLSHIFQDQMLLFVIVGLCLAVAEQSGEARCTATATTKRKTLPSVLSSRQPSPTPVSTMPSSTISLFGMNIDCLNLSQATQRIIEWCSASDSTTCRYVVTPNVDHAVQLTDHEGLRKSYDSASLVLADGAPIVGVSRLLGRPLPGRVAGSDLVPALLAAAGQPDRKLRVFLLGAGPGVAERAAASIHKKYPGVEVVGTHCPPLGFERDPAANQQAIAAVNAKDVDLLVIGLGAPKQELWIAEHCDQLSAKVAVCAGATIDFLAGEKSRSPKWMQQVGLEWLHRLASEPRRLAKRYFRDAVIFPQLVWSEYRKLSAS